VAADWDALDWTCPTCAAPRTKTCTTKDGRPRPTHLARRFTSILLQFAVGRGRGQPPAERAQIVRSLTMAQESDTSAREGYLWHQATDELFLWDQVVAAAGRHAAAAVDGHLDGDELFDAAEQAAHRITQARELLREWHSERAEYPLDEELLAHVLRPAPSLLARARHRGDLQRLEADLARRPVHLDRPGGTWAATWHSDGNLTAHRDDGLCVRGWSATPDAVEQALQSFEATSRHRPQITLTLHGERPEAPAAGSDAPGIDGVDVLRAFDADRAALDATVAAITQLQQSWPEHEISDRVRAATTQLQTSAPQPPHFNLYNRQQEHDWAASESAAWVRTDAIVHAVDKVWGDFDRSEASRGPSWIPRAARELLTTKPEQLAAFLRHHLAEEPAISLSVINGPAGPLYNISMGGAHRTHLFRILGLPWMIAKLYAPTPPRRFDVASAIETAKGKTEVERVGRGWHTLLERDLLHGRIRYEGAFAMLDLDHAPAPWLLGDAALVSAYNTAYERVYPGALTELGIPATALTGRKAWELWLYG
jgi:YD repeat-containing protein